MCAKGPNLRAQSWNIASTTDSMTQKAKKGCSQMEKSPLCIAIAFCAMGEYQTARRASIRHVLSTGIPEEIDWAKDEEIRPWPFIAY